MGKEFPDPTPPKETSAAQTGTSVSTAVANAFLQNPSEITPNGSTNVNPTGTYKWTDPYTGQSYNIPTFTRTTTLTPEGQAIKSQTDGAQLNLAKTANQQSGFLQNYLGTPFDPNMDYSWDSSKATPESRRWVAYTPEQMAAMGGSGGGGSAQSGNMWEPAAFTPKSYDDWRKEGFAKYSADRIGDPNSGASYSFADTQGEYQKYVDGARKAHNDAQEKAFTQWQMQNQGGGGGGAPPYSGPGGYWDITPGTSGAMVAKQKTGSDRLQDWSTLGNENYEESRKRVEDALFSRLEPRLTADREALENRLVNSGLRLGSDLYSKGVNEFTQQSNDARMQAILAGGQEQSRLFGMDQSRAGFNNNVRLQQFQEALARRNQPLNEIAALLSGSQLQMPQFMGANLGPIPTTDNAGIIQNYDNQKLQAAQMQNQLTGQLMGGLFGLGGKLIGLSDRRTKKDIEKVGKIGKLPVYEYRYKHEAGDGEKHLGFMAQDVEKRNPDAVINAGGLKLVDYGKALLEAA